MSDETEAFWSPIVRAAITDFADLRLAPPLIDHQRDQIMIVSRTGYTVAILTRPGAVMSDDPARTLVEMARAVAPKRLA